MSYCIKTVDARLYQPRDKHAVILNAYQELNKGEAMELLNDHDPKPLRYQFMAEFSNQFDWDYSEQGPDLWRVVITKK